MAAAYDLKLVVCTIGGVAISGYGENDAISFEWDENIVTKTVTADGKVQFSRNNNRGLTATITVSQLSRSYALLASMLEAQHGENTGVVPPAILPLPFYLHDPSNGDTITSQDTVFVTRPAPSKGKTVGEVQFEVCLPDPRNVHGPLNAL